MKSVLFLKIAILGFWLVMVGLLIHRNYLRPQIDRISFASIKDTLEIGEEWMGIYFKGEKVGYAATVTKRKGDSYEILEHSLMRINMMGTKQRIEARLKSFLDTNYSLKSFDFSLSSGAVNFSLQGEVSGKSLNLTINSGKNKNQTSLLLKESPYLANSLKPYILKSGLEVGKKFNLPFFDPSTMSSSEILVEVVGKESMVHAGKSTTVFRLKEFFQGIETRVWVSESGETLKEESPLGFTMVKQSQEEALSGEWMKGIKPDINLVTAIAVDKPINDARSVQFLKIRLTNLPHEQFNLSDGRQKLEGDILEIRKEDPRSWKTFFLPYQKRELKKYLQPTPFIQSGDKRIIRLAGVITKGSQDAGKAASMLLSWVFNNLKKKYTMSIPDALEVLDLKAGDCNEHTVLYTALSRSLGIPTRMCAGLVYMEKRFFYHAWPEIFLGKWVAVDPTLNQFPADATHIRLVVGDLSDQIKILNIVGQLKVEVLGYS